MIYRSWQPERAADFGEKVLNQKRKRRKEARNALRIDFFGGRK